MLVQYLSAKLGIVTDMNLPEVCRGDLPAVRDLVSVAAGGGHGDGHRHRRVHGRRPRPEPALRRAPAGRRLHHRRHRVRSCSGCSAAAFAASSWPSRRLLGIIFAGFLYETLRISPPADLLACRARAPLRRQRLDPAGRGHRRRHRDAPRHLPALGAHQRPRAGAQRARAPPHPALRAPRRGGRPGPCRPHQHGHARRGSYAVPRAAGCRRSRRSSRPTRASPDWSAAARRWPSPSPCWPRVSPRLRSAPMPVRWSWRASST